MSRTFHALVLCVVAVCMPLGAPWGCSNSEDPVVSGGSQDDVAVAADTGVGQADGRATTPQDTELPEVDTPMPDTESQQDTNEADTDGEVDARRQDTTLDDDTGEADSGIGDTNLPEDVGEDTNLQDSSANDTEADEGSDTEGPDTEVVPEDVVAEDTSDPMDIDMDIAMDADEDATSDTETPQDVDGDADDVSDTDLGLLCQFEGAGTQLTSEECGCDDDCIQEAPRCERNVVLEPLGPSYCTTDCSEDTDCPTGFGCFAGLELVGVPPFCQRCASEMPGTAGLNQECICDADCAPYDDGMGNTRETACIERTCAISPCGSFLSRCPEGFSCETVGLDVTVRACVACTHSAPQSEGATCSCEDDCSQGLACIDAQCRRTCEEDADCNMDEECRFNPAGGGTCREPAQECEPGANLEIGQLCTCNAECSADAPDCLGLNVAGFEASACTLRPCDITAADACPSGGNGVVYRCCDVPFLVAATCVPQALATSVESFARCSPAP